MSRIQPTSEQRSVGESSLRYRASRRVVLSSAGLLLASAALPRAERLRAQPSSRRSAEPPAAEQGLAIGDVRADRAVIWSRANRAGRMLVEYAFDESFLDPVAVRGPRADVRTDCTARLELGGLPPDRDVFVRVAFAGGERDSRRGEPVLGRFRTAPSGARNVRFLWSGDTAGQGWGINPEFGGMRIYETMRRASPDFFIHSGDTVYADGPILPMQLAEGGREWRNVVTPEVAKVAETLDEFRGRYRYNLLDANVRRFNAEVPQIWQWDDHEVTNNWSGTKELDDRYRERSVPLLVARATRAFLEYAPMRLLPAERIYRRIPYGPLCDVFVVDMRSYRGPNTFNRETAETPFLGRPQLDWLSRGLQASQATWKVIAADMPIGLQVGDGKDAHGRPRFENLANGDGPPLGREIEMARLLRSIRDVKNVVWFTADTHYTAAHFYNPAKARFTEFSPFWEFMSGPLHAGTFGPSQTDDTFGIEVVYQKHCTRPNMAPSEGMQFFGDVRIDAKTREMSVVLRDLTGAALFTKTLDPA